MPAAVRYVRSGDVQLAVYLQGNPQHPVVLLVHGYPDDHTVWDAVVQALCHDFCVVSYDVRGAGASSQPAQQADYRLEPLARDLQAVMAAVSPQRPVHLVAHDWGSIQSWEAVTDPAADARIASFTSVSGPCLDHMGFWLRDKLRRPTPGNLAMLLGQLLRSWYVMLFHLPGAARLWPLGLARLWPALLGRVEGVVVAPRRSQSRDGAAGVRLYRANFLRRLWSPRQRSTSVPVQLILPVQDHFVSPHLYDGMARWVSRLWLRPLAAGHWLPLHQPAQLATMIREFACAIESGHHEPMAHLRVRGPVRVPRPVAPDLLPR